MPKSGPRPHCWKVKGELNHEQYIAWLRMKAQAQFRDESFRLSFEQFQELWNGFWDQRGRTQGSYCLTRINPKRPWNVDNTVCVERGQAIANSVRMKANERHKQRA